MKIRKRPIYASAMRRGDLAMWIEDRIHPVMLALSQLYVFPNSEYRNHWITEVWANFHDVKLLKHGKLPSADFILRSGWLVNKPYAKKYIQIVIHKESSLVPRSDTSFDNLIQLMDNYFSWLADILSKDRLVDRYEVETELSKLGV